MGDRPTTTAGQNILLRLKRNLRKAILASILVRAAVVGTGWFYFQTRKTRLLANVPREFGREERISFLAVGRQGYGNQWATEVAASMGRVASEHETHFVVLTGDNFWPSGVASVTDRQWQDKFEDLYSSASLSSLPFFAVLGNHDHDGRASAQLAYSIERRGSGRWRMPKAQYHQDFGQADHRVLVRIVFLDTVPMARSWWKNRIAGWFLSEAMALPGDPVWRIVVGHAGVRSRTQHRFTRTLVLDDLLPLMQKLRVDLVLTGNDRFQQVLDMPSEPLHVSTNGGGAKVESELQQQESDSVFIAARPGFSRVTVDRRVLEVAMMDRHGDVTYRKSRTR